MNREVCVILTLAADCSIVQFSCHKCEDSNSGFSLINIHIKDSLVFFLPVYCCVIFKKLLFKLTFVLKKFGQLMDLGGDTFCMV